MVISFEILSVQPYFLSFFKWNKVDCFRFTILVLTNLCAAKASSLSCIMCFIFSLKFGSFVCWNVTGMEIGLSPRISLKGVCFHSACLLLLCVNSIVVREFSQSLG